VEAGEVRGEKEQSKITNFVMVASR